MTSTPFTIDPTQFQTLLSQLNYIEATLLVLASLALVDLIRRMFTKKSL